MLSKRFTILSRLSSTLPSSHRFPEALTSNALALRSYSTFASLMSLGQSTVGVVTQLDKLVEEGNKVKAAELKRIIRTLRNRGKDSNALEVSEWMYKNGFSRFSPSDHAVQLDLIGKVRGPDAAESYFNKMSDNHKNEKTYGALLNCYVRKCLTDKSLSHIKTMKELGYASTVLTYNDLMCLYANLGQYEKVPDVLAEMKENGVSPDNFSYRTCMISYGMRSDVNEMEKLLEEMESQNHIEMDWKTYSVVAKYYLKAGLTDKAIAALKKLEEKLDKKHDHGYNYLISLYSSVGNKTEVLKFWELKKAACKRCLNKDYMAMLDALAKLGEMEEAKSLLKEWESCGNGYDFRVPNTLLIAYCEKGLVEEAEALLEDIVKSEKTPKPNSWAILAAGYIAKEEMLKATECMKKALSAYVGNEGWRPKPKLITSILGWLGDEGKVEDVETFVGLLKAIVPIDREMYHALLKAYLREGKEVDGLLKSMEADGIDEDEETKNILSSRQS
ncbi:pentatricopeptide repeat-containing protein At4g21705, mitochondrial [Telopea speciosissima]|uniref:pentatricopeptide repeat-containing protein At4g21705, mitochondrial n=1 Tax=Telopea speciosissima TaxID=54955 RepID=UPI001CC4D962|nr:pentatricopeptide repeat-containing protein At4g21705, mitochondrial [Telopea speciosissima]